MRAPRSRPQGRARGPARAAPALGLAAALGVAWWALRAAPAAWVDGVWAERLLPAFTRIGAPLLAASPVSVSAISLGAIVLGAIAALVLRRPRPLWAWTCVVVLGAGATFELAWGVAYRRTPIEATWALPTAAPDAATLLAVLADVASIAAESAPEVPPNAATLARWPADTWSAAAACVAEADAIASERDRPLALAPVVRRLPSGSLLQAGFAGFVVPWWREPHVDAGLPATSAIATGLHELMHAAGWGREAETDALATLAGLRCDDRDVRFAAAVHALALLRAEAGRVDAALLDPVDARLAELPAAVAVERAALEAAVARYVRPAWRTAAGRTYDAYLRAQGIADGRADYGRAAVLLAASMATCATPAAVPLCPAP